jgi:hypothetical protein
MFSRLLGSFGFRTTFEVSFEKIVSWKSDTTLPLPTVVPISRKFFEADVTVRMDETEAANTFELKIYGMGEDIYNLLNPKQTIVHISLGYSDGKSQEVMKGLLTKKHLQAGDCWYEATLSGVDYIYERLKDSSITINKTYENKTIGDIAQDICSIANITPNIAVPRPEPLTLTAQTFSNVQPLKALQKVANLGDFVLQARDGKLWIGNPADLGVTTTTPITDGATSEPVVASGDSAESQPQEGQNFKIAGIPSLRPYDLVTFGTKQYRIQSIAHELKREGGYQCSGRAVSPTASRQDMQAAARPNANYAARQIGQNLAQREQKRPAVSAGEVKEYKEGQHTATVNIGQDTRPDMVSPSVQALLSSDAVPLPHKPMAAPFAFGGCGLIVPVYPKMRALLVHAWHEPDDAIVDGFLWPSDKTPPPNKQGDWWLCLPTDQDADGFPTGHTVDDLITKDGQRIIQVKGMTITIGAGLLNSVGSRPSPGSDESLTIQAGQNTKITVQDGSIELTDGQVKMTISNGSVSIS